LLIPGSPSEYWPCRRKICNSLDLLVGHFMEHDAADVWLCHVSELEAISGEQKLQLGVVSVHRAAEIFPDGIQAQVLPVTQIHTLTVLHVAQSPQLNLRMEQVIVPHVTDGYRFGVLRHEPTQIPGMRNLLVTHKNVIQGAAVQDLVELAVEGVPQPKMAGVDHQSLLGAQNDIGHAMTVSQLAFRRRRNTPVS